LQMFGTFVISVLLFAQFSNGVWVRENELMDLVEKIERGTFPVDGEPGGKFEPYGGMSEMMAGQDRQGARAWSNTRIQSEITKLKTRLSTDQSNANSLDTDVKSRLTDLEDEFPSGFADDLEASLLDEIAAKKAELESELAALGSDGVAPLNDEVAAAKTNAETKIAEAEAKLADTTGGFSDTMATLCTMTATEAPCSSSSLVCQCT